MLAFLDAKRQQTLCQPIHFLLVLAISQAKIEADLRVVVDERFLVGVGLALAVEQLTDGEVQQLNAAALSFPGGSIVDYSHAPSRDRPPQTLRIHRGKY